ncbi:MAG: hypothetical protein OEZ36_10635, partial [Spirochaetota bacterium]|nr:hypothetical protein [Spirochaetota bacterium]
MEYPHVLAPSMGCPAIISVKKPEIKVIIASLSRPKLDSGEKWTLTPSRSTKIPADQSLALNLTDIKEIKPDDKPDIFSLKEGWDIISRELVNRVFEGKAKVYKLSLSIDDSELDKMKKLFDGGLKNILYDLHYSGNHVQSKPHAVNLIEDTNKKLNFIHLTDLHLARRNDFIKEEIDIQ